MQIIFWELNLRILSAQGLTDSETRGTCEGGFQFSTKSFIYIAGYSGAKGENSIRWQI